MMMTNKELADILMIIMMHPSGQNVMKKILNMARVWECVCVNGK